MTNLFELKQRAGANVDAMRDELVQLSETIHAHHEIAFQEFE